MNKLVFLSTFTLLAILPASSFAEFTGSERKSTTTTIQDFKKQCDLAADTSEGGLISGLVATVSEGAKCDESEFVLQGNIVTKVSGHVYEFKDASGSINVSIEDWNGVDAGPDDVVSLCGKADYEASGLLLNVQTVEIAD